MNNKFDLVFEKALALINEREYINSTFEDNLRSLVKVLKDNDFLAQGKDSEQYVKQILAQPKNVKEIILDTQEQSLPAMKIHASQDTDSESFTVKVINLEKPDAKGNEFTNSMLETVFDNVIDYIKTTAIQGLSPDNAVEEMPPTEGAEAQPGAGESELPTEEEPAPEETEEQPQG